MYRLALLFVLVGCRGDDKHSLPVVKPSGEPTPEAPKVETSAIEGKMKELFGATQAPDTAAQIAKLEAQRATLPEGERKLIDRTIALIKSGELAMAERDKTKARQLQLQLMRDTIALYDDMAAAAPDDLGTNAMVASSFKVTADQVESLGLADEISPRMIKGKARAIAERMIKVHATNPRAWALHASVTPYSEPELRLRSLARCVKLEPTNASCKKYLDDERADYVRPYCEGTDLKPVVLEWREVSKKPIAGGSTVEHHYETWHVAPTTTFSWKDVVRVRSDESQVSTHADGKVEDNFYPSVTFELAPGKHDAMVAWSRVLELRDDGFALFLDGKLLFIDQRARWEDSSPGITNVKIDQFCAKTKTRTLPALD
jgi:hypothetical protein